MNRTAAHSQGRVRTVFRTGEEGGRVLMAHATEAEPWEVLADLIETADALEGVPVFCIVAGVQVLLSANAGPEELVREFRLAARQSPPPRVVLTDNASKRDRVILAWAATEGSKSRR